MVFEPRKGFVVVTVRSWWVARRRCPSLGDRKVWLTQRAHFKVPVLAGEQPVLGCWSSLRRVGGVHEVVRPQPGGLNQADGR